jgi:hypothetical protein
MSPFVQILKAFTGQAPLPAAVTDEISKKTPNGQILAGMVELGATPTPFNFAALLALLVQLLPVLLPMFGL